MYVADIPAESEINSNLITDEELFLNFVDNAAQQIELKPKNNNIATVVPQESSTVYLNVSIINTDEAVVSNNISDGQRVILQILNPPQSVESLTLQQFNQHTPHHKYTEVIPIRNTVGTKFACT